MATSKTPRLNEKKKLEILVGLSSYKIAYIAKNKVTEIDKIQKKKKKKIFKINKDYKSKHYL